MRFYRPAVFLLLAFCLYGLPVAAMAVESVDGAKVEDIQFRTMEFGSNDARPNIVREDVRN